MVSTFGLKHTVNEMIWAVALFEQLRCDTADEKIL